MLRLVFIGITLLTWAGFSYAACSSNGSYWRCDTQGEAYAACLGKAASSNSNAGSNLYGCIVNGEVYQCKHNSQPFSCNAGSPSQNLFSYIETCDQQPVQQQIFTSQEPDPICQNGCEYEATTGTCNSSACLFNTEPTGQACGEPPDYPPSLPDNCIRNEETGAVACDCSVDPDQAWCQSPPGDPPANNCATNEETGVTSCYEPDPPVPPTPTDGSDGQYNGGNDGSGGDGDPDTPDADGEGDGDVDDDGDRDIDCNPESNADCQRTGNASASALCSAPTTCVGDPAQCATLRQVYNLMCANIAGNQTRYNQLEEIKKRLPAENIPINDVDYKAILASVKDKKDEILNADGSFFAVGEANEGKLAELKAYLLSEFNTHTNSIFVTAACPNFTVDLSSAGLNYTFPFDATVGRYTRAIMAVFLWVWALYTSYWLFAKWSLKD